MVLRTSNNGGASGANAALNVRKRRQHLVFNSDQLERTNSDALGFGGDRRDQVTNVADLVGRYYLLILDIIAVGRIEPAKVVARNDRTFSLPVAPLLFLRRSELALACACGDRNTLACSIRGKDRSLVYFAAPVTLRSASKRGAWSRRSSPSSLHEAGRLLDRLDDHLVACASANIC